MRYIVTINDKSYEVDVEKGQASIVRTTPAAAPAPVVEPKPVAQEEVAQSSTVQNNVVSGNPVKAPMPGTIMAVG